MSQSFDKIRQKMGGGIYIKYCETYTKKQRRDENGKIKSRIFGAVQFG